MPPSVDIPSKIVKDQAFWFPKDCHSNDNRAILSCGSQNIPIIAGKEEFHREVLLEKNINEDVFQWILGYPCMSCTDKKAAGGIPGIHAD